jgi:hypothetical protein
VPGIPMEILWNLGEIHGEYLYKRNLWYQRKWNFERSRKFND